MNSKMKTIFIVFGVVVILFIIQSIISYISTEKKRENFENDQKPERKDDEDIKPKVEKNSQSEKNSTVDTTKTLKLSILESVENVFSEHFPGSNQKSVMFDELLKRENFEDIKVKEQMGQDVQELVTSYIKDHMKKLEEEDKKTDLNIKDFYQEPPKSVKLSELYTAKEENDTTQTKGKADVVKERFTSTNVDANQQIDEIRLKISKLQAELELLEKQTQNPLPASPAKPSEAASKSEAQSQSKGQIIEGFENRYMYAPF